MTPRDPQTAPNDAIKAVNGQSGAWPEAEENRGDGAKLDWGGSAVERTAVDEPPTGTLPTAAKSRADDDVRRDFVAAKGGVAGSSRRRGLKKAVDVAVAEAAAVVAEEAAEESMVEEIAYKEDEEEGTAVVVVVVVESGECGELEVVLVVVDTNPSVT